ncbi:hypothetical protein AB3X89_40770, partial [Paraburkholderia sp. BR14320]
SGHGSSERRSRLDWLMLPLNKENRLHNRRAYDSNSTESWPYPKYGYGQRALVESQISRIKRCIGARLLTRNIESQQREGVIIAN